MQTSVRPLTAEEFWLLPEGEGKRELVRGQVVEWMPVGGVHGDVVLELAVRLRIWAKQGQHGYVGTEVGYRVHHNPDSVRAADISFVRQDRIPKEGIPEGFMDFAPDLAVEVVSPFESAEDIQDKTIDYIMAGTPQVWVVYPRQKQVVVHMPDGLARTFKGEDKLEFPQLLPGFSCTVAELFG